MTAEDTINGIVIDALATLIERIKANEITAIDCELTTEFEPGDGTRLSLHFIKKAVK